MLLPAERTARARWALATIAILALAHVSGWAGAQEGAAEVPPAVVEVIPPAEMPRQAGLDRARMANILERIPADEAPAGGEHLEELVGHIEAFLARAGRDRLDGLPASRIEQMQRQAAFYASELESFEKAARRAANRLSEDAAELAGIRERWRATLDSASASGLSRALAGEARKLLRELEQLQRELDRPLFRALRHRDEVLGHVDRVRSLRRRLDDAAASAAGQLLRLDFPPIWRIPRTNPAEVYAAARSVFLYELSFLRDYLEANRRGIEGFTFLTLLLAGLILWVRRRPAWKRLSVEDLPDAGRLLERPVSAMAILLLLAVMLGARSAPMLLSEMLAVLVLIPLIRLAPRRMVAGHPGVLYLFALLIFVDRPRSLLPLDSVAFRSVLLLVALAGLAGAAWLIRLRRRDANLPARSWVGLLARAGPLLAALFGSSLAANVLGNISLADMLLRGTLVSVFASAVLFAAAVIVHDILALFVRTRLGLSLRMVTLHGERITGWIQWAARWLAILTWLWATLRAFGLWEQAAARTAAVLDRSWRFGELEISLGGVTAFLVGVVLAFYAARAVRFVLNEEIMVRLPWPTGAKSTTATLVYYAVLLAGLLLAFAAAGIQTTQFAIIAGALGVGIGFGLQTVVNNFVSGLILMFERPIQPGDIIDVDTLQGRVLQIGLRATRVKTWEGAEVVVPNGTLLSGNLINWTLSDSKRRVDINVGVAYGTDVRRVLEILGEVARRQPLALKDPEPLATFNGFGDSSLDFTVRFWIRDAGTALTARSAAYVEVCEALAAEGVEIPFPQRDLHLRSVDEGAAGLLADRPAGS